MSRVAQKVRTISDLFILIYKPRVVLQRHKIVQKVVQIFKRDVRCVRQQLQARVSVFHLTHVCNRIEAKAWTDLMVGGKGALAPKMPSHFVYATEY